MANDIVIQNRVGADYIGFLSTPLGARIGGEQDTLGRLVMGYLADASFSNHPELRPFNRQAMMFEARAFLNCHSEDTTVCDEIVKKLLPKDVDLEVAIHLLVQEISHSIESLKERYVLGRRWKELLQEKDLALQENDQTARRQRLVCVFDQLYHLKKPLEAVLKSNDQRAWDVISRNLNHIVAARRVQARFKAIIKKEGLDPSDPAKISACYKALHQSQKRAVEALGSRAADAFNQQIQDDPDAFNFWRFGNAEECMFASSVARDEQDRAVRFLWTLIKTHFPNVMGPPVGSSSDAIREWMNGEQAGSLRDVTSLDIGNLNIGNINRAPFLKTLPPEIGRLTRLESLSVEGGRAEHHNCLSGLPEEMRELQVLKSLSFDRNHNFREIPPVIGELVSLETLQISGPIEEIPEFLADLPHLSSLWIRESRIHEIPVAVWRHVCRESFTGELGRFLEGARKSEYEVSRMTFGINPEQLTDIPLSLSLLQQYSIPYLPLLGALGDLAKDFIGWTGLHRAHIVFQGLFFPPLFLISIPVGLGLFVLQALINFPIFLYNLALTYSDIGGDEMVHCDLPVEPEAPQQALQEQ